jgi:uncharacterized protein (TIGR03067 family)
MLSGVLGLVIVAQTIAVEPRKNNCADKPGTNDLEKIQGTWKLMALESMVNAGRYWRRVELQKLEGKKLLEEFGDLRVTFSGGRFSLSYLYKKGGAKKDSHGGRFTLDQTKNPKQIDLLGETQGEKLPCIYKLEGDELTVCFAFELFKAPSRPRNFTLGDESPNWVLTFRREKKRDGR